MRVAAVQLNSNADKARNLGAAEDFYGDGRSELVWRNTTTGAVSMWEVRGTSIIGTPIATADLSLTIQGVGDYDGDGRGHTRVTPSSFLFVVNI